jgi:hypothetical protein
MAILMAITAQGTDGEMAGEFHANIHFDSIKLYIYSFIGRYNEPMLVNSLIYPWSVDIWDLVNDTNYSKKKLDFFSNIHINV